MMTKYAAEDPATRNVAAVAQIEQSERLRRTAIERAIDRLATWAGHPSFPLFHVFWFAVWLSFNVWSARPFDSYPFTFLTLVVSLEAILLTFDPSAYFFAVAACRRWSISIGSGKMIVEFFSAAISVSVCR